MPDIKKYLNSDMQFIATIAHDMKTPVSAQIRAANLLYSGLCGEFTPEAKNIILNIIASNKYLQTLLNNVLDSYRINNGNYVLHKEIKDIRYTIEQSLLNIGILSEIKEQKVEIKYLSENLVAYYDEIEMQRVIINVLSNAFKYAKECSPISIFANKIFFKIKIKIVSTLNDIQLNEDIIKKSQNLSMGLGFDICKNILKSHKGSFEYYTSKDDKFIVNIEFPAV